LDRGINRDAVILAMREKGVETTLGTYAVHAQPFYRKTYGYQAGDLPNSYTAFKQGLTLPLYPQMDEDMIDEVTAALSVVISDN
jgi:dTDP-4-amino-4,6-dideoxygalactose transaminase